MSLRLAKKIAAANDLNTKWMLGAVVSRNRAVLALGMNKPKNDPAFIDNYAACSVHAEEDALSRVAEPKGTTIYIARLRKNGTFGLAKPCPRCQKQLRAAGIKRAIYTIDNYSYGTWIPEGINND